MSLHAAVVRLELMIPGARSLKDKRRTVKSMVDRMHSRMRVSVAETDLHDLHRRAEIGLAVVAASERDLERLLGELQRIAEESPEAVVASWEELD
jgi:uncharacterized protein YlxP (DUF503 family)